MKKMMLLMVIALMTVTSMVVMAGCKSAEKGNCRIHGTMESNRWDGKKIFLVPMFGLQDAAHVDSVVIKDGKFEFVADTTEMKVIRIDYHYRDGAGLAGCFRTGRHQGYGRCQQYFRGNSSERFSPGMERSDYEV